MTQSRHHWTLFEIQAVYKKPFLELVFEAAKVHRQHFNPREVQVSRLVSIKTGGCPEDCGYCPQAARYNTGVGRSPLMQVDEVLEIAKEAKAQKASRLCLGAAWREVKDNAQFDRVLEMVKEVNAMGLEVCCTLGMLTADQAQRLKAAGLYAYNHNLDTSSEHYSKVISTRSYDERLKTLENVRQAGITVCCGGILGLGESIDDRLQLLLTLSQLPEHPESVPINTLVKVTGTPLGNSKKKLDDELAETSASASDVHTEEPQDDDVSIWDLVRMIATARIVLPKSHVRLSAGRVQRSWQDQSLCFMAGANSIFIGDKLLTTPNNSRDEDMEMFDLLGLLPSSSVVAKEQVKETVDKKEEPTKSAPLRSKKKNEAELVLH